MAKNLYVILQTSTLDHNVVYQVRARSIDEAIEVFHLKECHGLKKLKNGKWRWGKDYYDSIKDVLAEGTDLAFEIGKVKLPIQEPCDEIFCSIDWSSVLYSFKSSFKGAKKLGRFYEWYSPNSEFYAFFTGPEYLSKELKHLKKKK